MDRLLNVYTNKYILFTVTHNFIVQCLKELEYLADKHGFVLNDTNVQ